MKYTAITILTRANNAGDNNKISNLNENAWGNKRVKSAFESYDLKKKKNWKGEMETKGKRSKMGMENEKVDFS